MTELDRFKRVCRKYLVIEDDTFIDILFGVIFANRLNSKPVWLYLVGPPSCGKTEIPQAMAGHSEIYDISRLTTHSLVSHWGQEPRKGKIKGKKPEDQSLLPKLDGRVMVIKDFTAMLTMRRESLHEILGTLRDAYDGKSRTKTGIAETYYKSKFGLIASVTNIIDKHRAILAELGERCISYRMPEITDIERYKRCMMALSIEDVVEQERELTKVAHRVLNTHPPVATLTKLDKRNILLVAQFAAKARCEVSRDRYTGEPDIPQSEVPTRLSKQLKDLAIGIAMARGRSKVTLSEIKIVQRIAIDSLTLKRIRLIKTMLPYYPEYARVTSLADSLCFSDETVRRWLEDLYLLELAEKKPIISGETGQEIYVWRLINGLLLKRIFSKYE